MFFGLKSEANKVSTSSYSANTVKIERVNVFKNELCLRLQEGDSL